DVEVVLRRHEERLGAAEAEADDADAPVDLGQLAQVLERTTEVGEPLLLVELAGDAHALAKGRLGEDLDPEVGLDPPERVRCEHHVPGVGESVGDRLEVAVHPADLLDEQQARTHPARGEGHVAGEGAAVAGGDPFGSRPAHAHTVVTGVMSSLTLWTSPSCLPSPRCSPRPSTTSPPATTSGSNRSGTASGASCSATATRWSWAAATS